MNAMAVELSVRMALALNCTIPDFAKWDRKHYYYPDLPKNYQISEYDQPLGVGGYLDIETSAGPRRIGIMRVHLEEDAGKLMHAEGGNYSVVDLNRTGTPLLEIVSEPDMHSAEEARLYAESLRQLAVYLGVGHCNMQLGQMRCEPNVSLRIGTGPDGKPRYTPDLGTEEPELVPVGRAGRHVRDRPPPPGVRRRPRRLHASRNSARRRAAGATMRASRSSSGPRKRPTITGTSRSRTSCRSCPTARGSRRCGRRCRNFRRSGACGSSGTTACRSTMPAC